MRAETILGHPPFSRPDGTPVPELEGKYRNREAVLICGGASFLSVDHEMIRKSGRLTMTLNDGVRTFRSDLWLSVDPITRFDSTIWEDEHIMKFLPAGRAFDEHARQGINVIVYRHSHAWCSESIFAGGATTQSFNTRGDGARTSMINAIRVLFLLGVRTIYLFGVDFFQSRSHGYHHPVPGFQRRIGGNNRLYARLARRLSGMRPMMEKAGLKVYNCNPDSRLEVFEKLVFSPDPEPTTKL